MQKKLEAWIAIINNEEYLASPMNEFWFHYANAVLKCECGALVTLSPKGEEAEAATEISGEEEPEFKAVDIGNGWNAVFVKRKS